MVQPAAAGFPAITRSAPATPPMSRAAWCRSTIRARAPHNASIAISAARIPASSSITGSWPPDIHGFRFELDLFSTLQQHHNEDADYVARKGRDQFDVQVWAIGQAMALDRALSLCSPIPRAAPKACSPSSISSIAIPAIAGFRTIRLSSRPR